MTCISVAWDMGYIKGGSVLVALPQISDLVALPQISVSGGSTTISVSSDSVTISVLAAMLQILWCVADGWVELSPHMV